jgi:hypothetical protein
LVSFGIWPDSSDAELLVAFGIWPDSFGAKSLFCSGPGSWVDRVESFVGSFVIDESFVGSFVIDFGIGPDFDICPCSDSFTGRAGKKALVELERYAGLDVVSKLSSNVSMSFFIRFFLVFFSLWSFLSAVVFWSVS